MSQSPAQHCYCPGSRHDYRFSTSPLTAAQISVYIFNQTENDSSSSTPPLLQVNPQPTDADGHYRLILPAGKYYLEITAPGQRKQRPPFLISLPPPLLPKLLPDTLLFLRQLVGSNCAFQSTNIPSTPSPPTPCRPTSADFDLSTADFAFSNTTILGKPTVITLITSWTPNFRSATRLDRFQATNPGINIVP